MGFVSQQPPKANQKFGTATTARAATSAPDAARLTTSTSPREAPCSSGYRPVGGADIFHTSLSRPILFQRKSPLCYSAAAAAATGGAAGVGADDTTTKTIMSAENEMPTLKVLRVDEVPTVKADPVDPVAREQAKVRVSLLDK